MNNNKKQIVRLTESDLHRIIKESVNNILKEINVIGKIDDFDKDKSYGEHFKSVNAMNKYFNRTPNEKIHTINTHPDDVVKIANLITKQRMRFKIMPLAKRKEMINILRDYAKEVGLGDLYYRYELDTEDGEKVMPDYIFYAEEISDK
jgi:hypothetical protein